MVVAFTSNIGLAKPDETEIAKNWATATQLADDNNLLIVDKSDIETLSYTPSLIGRLGNPNVGAGSIIGEYQLCQGFVWGSFRVIFLNPGVAVGSAEYAISLPFEADGTFYVAANNLAAGTGFNDCIGEGYFRDSSAVATCMTLALDLATFGGVSYVRFVTEAIAGKTSRVFSSTTPVAVADNDSFSGSFFYKRL